MGGAKKAKGVKGPKGAKAKGAKKWERKGDEKAARTGGTTAGLAAPLFEDNNP